MKPHDDGRAASLEHAVRQSQDADLVLESQLLAAYGTSLRDELDAALIGWVTRNHGRPQVTSYLVLTALASFVETVLLRLDDQRPGSQTRLPPFFEPWVAVLRETTAHPGNELTPARKRLVNRLGEALYGKPRA
jgi:hypothetical protein